MTPKAQELEDSWKVLRPGYIQEDWKLVPKGVLRRWVMSLGEGGSSKFLIEGPSPTHRASSCVALATFPTVVDLVRGWSSGVTEGVVSRPPVWRVLQDLVGVQDLFIEEPLKSIVDKGGRFTEVFRAIWEIRFLSREELVEEPFLRCLTDWVVTSRTSGRLLREIGIKKALARHQRLEVFLFLMALAHQNGVFERGVFILDGLEVLVGLPSKTRTARLQELVRFIEATDKWSQLGAPIGYIIGYSKKRCQGLENNRSYQKLVYAKT